MHKSKRGKDTCGAKLFIIIYWNMVKDEIQWRVGEIVTLSREVADLTNGSHIGYKRLIGSRYICIREESEGQRGILMKVLGKATKGEMMIVGGEPFCKDDADELFNGVQYLSYPFPTVQEVKEALSILQKDESLQHAFDKAHMHVNPRSTYWVNETASRLLFLKQPQYYDAFSDELRVPADNSLHYRVTMVYFYKGELCW